MTALVVLKKTTTYKFNNGAENTRINIFFQNTSNVTKWLKYREFQKLFF